MGASLANVDEGVHAPGDQENWNESRYIDFWNPAQQVGGWFPMGQRPNAGYAEMSAWSTCLTARSAFFSNGRRSTGTAWPQAT